MSPGLNCGSEEFLQSTHSDIAYNEILQHKFLNSANAEERNSIEEDSF